MSLRWYVTKRVIGLIPVSFAIISINILIILLAPGDPARIAAGLDPKIDVNTFKVLYHIIDADGNPYSLWDRYVYHLAISVLPQSVRAWLNYYPEIPTMGRSWSKYPMPVLDVFAYYVPRTLFMTTSTWLISLVVAFTVGALSATNRYSLYDRFTTVFLIVFYSIPYFFLAKMIMVASFYLTGFTGVFTSDAFDQPLLYAKYLILPAITIILGGTAFMSRYVRSRLLDVLNQDYILAARSKGLPESKVVLKHALKNVSLPLITIIMLSIPGLWTGALITETVFSYPGMGRVFFKAVVLRDFPLVIAGSVISSILLLVFILFSDILYAVVDPRISFD